VLLVGLTGGIASGKSTVSGMLAERGATIVDADHIAREVVMPGEPAWCKIRDHFGPGVLFADGSIDRQALGGIVFGDPAKLALLNEFTHPPILERIASKLEALAPEHRVVVLDAALLVEIGLLRGVDVVVVVDSPVEIQLERLAGKGLERTQAEARIAAQLPPERRRTHADVVIHNDGTLEELIEQVDKLWEDLSARLDRHEGRFERPEAAAAGRSQRPQPPQTPQTVGLEAREAAGGGERRDNGHERPERGADRPEGGEGGRDA
jgi:dephospho-CoA kinase